MSSGGALANRGDVKAALDVLSAWIAFLFELDPAGRPRRIRFGENYIDAVESW
jgi:hypothetical protein